MRLKNYLLSILMALAVISCASVDLEDADSDTDDSDAISGSSDTDVDTDSDGTFDSEDGCPNDINKIEFVNTKTKKRK